MKYQLDLEQFAIRKALEENYRRQLDEGMDVVLPPEIDPVVPYGIQETGNWGFSYLKIQEFQKAWAGKLRRKVGVAIVDTAWKFTHKDLEPYALNADGGAFANDKPENGDGHGHGHHCGGIVAAVNANFPIGVGPAKEGFVKVIPYGGLNSNGGGSYDWLRAAFEAAIETYVKKYKKEGWAWIISNSWGGISQDAKFLELVKQARAEGIIVNASAGNSGYKEGQSTVLYPAKFDEVAAIASIQDNGAPSSFSSSGPEVLFAAPGQSIYSTYKDNKYATASGTSMANPMLGGFEAWLLARFPEIEDQDHLEEFVKAHITDAHTPGFDVRTGFGVPKADSYVDKLPDDGDDDNPPPPPPPKKAKALVDVDGIALQFRSRAEGDNLYGFNNWHLYSAKVSFRGVEVEYEEGLFQGASKLLSDRLLAYTKMYDDRTYIPKGETPTDPYTIILDSKKSTFIDIANFILEGVQKRTGVKIHEMVFEVDDNVTFRI